jgi:hypothetical protein
MAQMEEEEEAKKRRSEKKPESSLNELPSINILSLEGDHVPSRISL